MAEDKGIGAKRRGAEGLGADRSGAEGTDAESPDDFSVIRCENLVKIYKKKDVEVVALQGLDLKVERGEVMAIVGNSGSGKSTLLNMIGGLDRPSAGRLYVCGKDLFAMSAQELVEYKRGTVGFVWQNNARNLLPYLTVLENVMMPMQIRRTGAGIKPEKKFKTTGGRPQKVYGHKANKEKAGRLLELVGLAHKQHGRLSGLSGGEQQRAAIAIALANSPELLLADEPTGSVDIESSGYLLDAFRQVNEEFGTTVVIVTHDRQITRKVNRVVFIRDGKVSSEKLATRKSLDGAYFSGGGVKGGYDLEHEEYAVLDRTGRVQLPAEYLEQMHIKGDKVKVGMEDGRLVISAPEDGGAGE